MKYETINYIPLSLFVPDEDERLEIHEYLDLDRNQYVNLIPIHKFINEVWVASQNHGSDAGIPKLNALMKKAEDVANNIAGPENLHIRIDN